VLPDLLKAPTISREIMACQGKELTLNIVVNTLSSPQGLLPANISSTRQPRDHMSTLAE
jgi:hypothetical protein